MDVLSAEATAAAGAAAPSASPATVPSPGRPGAIPPAPIAAAKGKPEVTVAPAKPEPILRATYEVIEGGGAELKGLWAITAEEYNAGQTGHWSQRLVRPRRQGAAQQPSPEPAPRRRARAPLLRCSPTRV